MVHDSQSLASINGVRRFIYYKAMHPLRREVRLEKLSQRARAAGVSADRLGQMKVIDHHYEQLGFRGNPNIRRWLLGRKPGSFKNYVERLT